MPTAGALRAGNNISHLFRRALPRLPKSNANTLAEIIDRETCCPEMLEVLETIENDANTVPAWLWVRIKEVIAKVKAV